MLKKLGVLLLLLPLSCSADYSSSYKSVVNAIHYAKPFRVYIDFAKCQPKRANTNAVFTPNTMSVVSKTVNFSDSHLTLNNPLFPGRAVLEQISYQLNTDDSF
jgi:hypothetical protein